MAEEQWTKRRFEELAEREVTTGLGNANTFLQHLRDFFQESFEHYETATDDGKAFVDGALKGLSNFFEQKLKGAPDTPDTRKLRRALAAVQGKHFQAQDLFESFSSLPDEPDKWMDKSAAVLIQAVQVLMDILHDAIREIHEGASNFTIIGLLFWLIDEVTVAQFLARRSYATLAYAHLRSIMEITDKIQLFTEQPATAEIWISGNEREVWKKLAPARVREKLGRCNFDPLYQYFSVQGSHSTFTAMQSRLRRQPDSAGKGVRIALMVGGIRDRARQVSILLYTVLLTHMATMRAVQAFSDRLNVEDVTQMLLSSTNESFGLFGTLFTEMNQQSMDTKPLEHVIEAWEKMRDQLGQRKEKTV